jgi:hypothetical protein
MSKVIKALLEAKFQNVNTDSLLEIISVTPNPEVATELLCGLYEEPEIGEVCDEFVKYNSDQVNIKFVSYDKWNDEVKYSYNKVLTETIWVRKALDESDYPKYSDIKDRHPEDDYFKGYWFEDICNRFDLNYKALKDYYIKVVIKGEPSEKVSKTSTTLSNWKNY